MKTYRLHNPLEHGSDLKPLQRALKGDKLYFGPIDGIFGKGSATGCEKGRWRLGYPRKYVIPVGDQKLLDYLQGKVGLPYSFRVRRRIRGFGLKKSDQQRALLVKWALWGAINTPNIHYTESSARDDWLWRRAGTLPLWTDCSGFVTACYKWSQLPDPNGLGYRAVGFTGTLLDHGITVPLHDGKPGDLIIWGWAPGHHVAILVEHGGLDPMIVSHGSESGPLHIRFSAENNAQQRPYVVKRYIRD